MKSLQSYFSESLRAFEKSLGFKNNIIWFIVVLYTFYHGFAIFWCYNYAFPAKWQTIVFAAIMYCANLFGVTGGAHRLWSHKAFKVNLPLKLFILMCFASAAQTSVRTWVHVHRLHHKYSDTGADPHNSSRGFFFSHIGWLMTKRSDEIITRGKQIDMSDIHNDPMLKIYDRHSFFYRLMFCMVLPPLIGVWLWGESWQCSLAWQAFIRFLMASHHTLFINSLAHKYGYKSYNKNIKPVQNRFVSIWTLGEGWHNYHHSFPFDYKAAERNDDFNLTGKIIRLFSDLGWAYDLKEATPEMIYALAERLGDGTLTNNSKNETS